MLRQIIISISALRVSKDFITRYRLWENWQSMKWMHTAFIVFAIFMGIKMFGIVGDCISGLGYLVSGDTSTMKLGFSGNIFTGDFSFLKSDTYKYLFLFFTLSLVYHFGGRALEILYNVPYKPTFKQFLVNQKRALLVLLVGYIIEHIFTGVVSGMLSITGGKWLSGVVQFIIQSFIFGAILIDGLHEVRGTDLRKGFKHSFNYYPGIALSLGAVGLALSYIPVIGVLLVGSIVTIAILIAIKRSEAVMI
ncbi:MAG: hypothetical protein ABIR66_11915 [Saprospiraceae bacterium]